MSLSHGWRKCAEPCRGCRLRSRTSGPRRRGSAGRAPPSADGAAASLRRAGALAGGEDSDSADELAAFRVRARAGLRDFFTEVGAGDFGAFLLGVLPLALIAPGERRNMTQRAVPR